MCGLLLLLLAGKPVAVNDAESPAIDLAHSPAAPPLPPSSPTPTPPPHRATVLRSMLRRRDHELSKLVMRVVSLQELINAGGHLQPDRKSVV